MENPILKKKIITAVVFAVCALLAVCCVILLTQNTKDGAAKDNTAKDDTAKETAAKETAIAISSESLSDGRWQEAVASSGEGKNESPQLSFGAVEGAASYVIYMEDESAQSWVHWYAETTETDLSAGANPGQYKGPYPPKGSGDHTYTIWVYALGDQFSPDKKDINFDAPGLSGEKLLEKLSAKGTVLGYGTISGTYSAD